MKSLRFQVSEHFRAHRRDLQVVGLWPNSLSDLVGWWFVDGLDLIVDDLSDVIWERIRG